MFAKLVVGVSRPLRMLRNALLWIFFSTHPRSTYLSMMSSAIARPVPTVGVITMSKYVKRLRPSSCSLCPTLPSDASLIGPISNCKLQRADQAIAFILELQYAFEPPNFCLSDLPLL